MLPFFYEFSAHLLIIDYLSSVGYLTLSLKVCLFFQIYVAYSGQQGQTCSNLRKHTNRQNPNKLRNHIHHHADSILIHELQTQELSVDTCVCVFAIRAPLKIHFVN